jgi:hypothetical protein
MIILCFLPTSNIDLISKASTKILEKMKLDEDYEILCINSKITSIPKELIEEYRTKAKINYKKGVIVLSGLQCSLGVSIDRCDIVILLNNIKSYDKLYQMMFRSMTEGINKKFGFVIDLNIHRVIETSLIEYGHILKPKLHPKRAIQYILTSNILNINYDMWLIENNNSKSDKYLKYMSKYLYEIYSSNTKNALKYFLKKISYKELLLDDKDSKLFNLVFNNSKDSKKIKTIIDELMDKDIKTGIDKKKNVKDIINDDSKVEEVEKKINFMEILKHIIPLLSILTINNTCDSFEKMVGVIKDNKKLYQIFMDQLIRW